MPANGPFRIGMAPQISISSPDEQNAQCELYVSERTVWVVSECTV